MPHDRNGVPLNLGDRVVVPCVVTALQPGDDYCNVSLETEVPMPPANESKQCLTLNTRQTEKVGPRPAA